MLKIEKVTKQFSNIRAVDDISLNFPDSTIFGLVGPNGAGKTTIIRMIMNIIQPDSGKITMNGYDSLHFDHFFIGYLPEERGVYQKAKVRDVIKYFATLRLGGSGSVNKQIDKWIQKLNIEKYTNMKVSQLSKGNQQKVQFILAVVHEPDLLILDEPFTGLDPVNQNVLHNIITEFKTQGKTIILSTHQMAKVEELCESFALINRGRIIKSGKTRDIMKEYGDSLDKTFIRLVGGENE